MASSNTSTKRGRAQDRRSVAGGQSHETVYEARESGASAADVRTAVKQVGNSRTKVRRALKK